MAKTDTQHNAAIDANKYPTLTVTSGTPGTADTTGTADIVRVGGNPATGAMYVQDLSGASGTTNVSVVNGTINRLHDAGTLGSIANVGVIHTAGTVSALPDLPGGTVDLVTRIGNIGTIESGTVTTTLALNSGTITTIAAGTQNTLGTVGVVNNLVTGTIAALTAMSVGTVGGKAASGAAAVANPILMAGTDAGGTVYAPLVTSAGVLSTSASLALNTGTITTIAAGTQNTLGTVGTVIGQGTLSNVGSVNTITTVSNLTNGTVRVSVGTIVVGTMVGQQANAGSLTTNPISVAGTDAGGTLYAFLTDTAGHSKTDVITGTLQAAGTVTGVGVVTSITNVVAGTLLNSGTTTGVGVVSNLTNGSINILTGTIQSSGTTTGVGVVSGLTTGTVTTIVAGTQNTLGTVGIVNSLLSQTAGTLNTLGTVGVLNSQAAGTQQTLGTVGVVNNIVTGTLAAITSVTNLAAGTIQLNQKPINLGTPFTTYGTTNAAVWGTIIAASGAGTKQYVENVDIVVHSGTVDVAITNIGVGGSTGAGVMARGQFPPGGGLQRSFFPPVASGTNGTLSYWLGGAGTVSIDIVYWQGV